MDPHWIQRFVFFTLEYIKLRGRLIAIDSSHTKNIFNTTRLRVLFRPKRIGYRRDKYLSIEIVHKCIILAVQNRTSKHIQTRQCSDWSGKYPGGGKTNLHCYCSCGFLPIHVNSPIHWIKAKSRAIVRSENEKLREFEEKFVTHSSSISICMQMDEKNFFKLPWRKEKHHLDDGSSRVE